MSHQIKVEGHFGSPSALKSVLDREGVKYNESDEGGKTWLTFPNKQYNLYGNPLRICLSHPEDSVMDSDVGRTVRGWYQSAMVDHVKLQALHQGARVQSERRQGQDIVLRLAVG